MGFEISGKAAANTPLENELLANALAANGLYVAMRNVNVELNDSQTPAPNGVMRMIGTIQWTDR